MTKRVSWNLYSKRRHITVQSLEETGKITDYNSYVAYCDKFGINPITEFQFETEVRNSKVHKTPIVSDDCASQSVADAPVEASLEIEKEERPPQVMVDAPLTSSVPDAPVLSNISDEPQTTPLIATVWLAGVNDETRSTVNMSSLIPQKQEDVRYKTKKKKNKG